MGRREEERNGEGGKWDGWREGVMEGERKVGREGGKEGGRKKFKQCRKETYNALLYYLTQSWLEISAKKTTVSTLEFPYMHCLLLLPEFSLSLLFDNLIQI